MALAATGGTSALLSAAVDVNDETMDVEMEEPPVDMGYEEHHPMPRRGSMSAEEEKERRASIKAIMADKSMSPVAKRRSIQHLMDGRRNSMSGSSSAGSVSSGCSTPDLSDQEDDMMMEPFEALPTGSGDYLVCNEQTRRAEQTRPPCSHYERNCTMIAPCCGAAFGCRICHDDCPILPPTFNSGGRRYQRSASLPSSFTCMDTSQPEDNQHTIDRFAVREVICRSCYTRQPCKT